MDTQDMVRMANQIAGYFGAYPEERAVTDTAYHLKSFWDPRMLNALKAHVKAGGESLSPLAIKAVGKL
jgi:formate dehydrogenase subunit delta